MPLRLCNGSGNAGDKLRDVSKFPVPLAHVTAGCGHVQFTGRCRKTRQPLSAIKCMVCNELHAAVAPFIFMPHLISDADSSRNRRLSANSRVTAVGRIRRETSAYANDEPNPTGEWRIGNHRGLRVVTCFVSRLATHFCVHELILQTFKNGYQSDCVGETDVVITDVRGPSPLAGLVDVMDALSCTC